jgi:hypothetical protein
MRTRSFYPEIFAVCLAAILIEISYTRILSYKFYYYFTYLVIGISLLGLGAGGVFVIIFPRLRSLAPSRLIPACSLLAGGAVFLGYFVIAYVKTSLFDLGATIRWLAGVALVCGSLFIPFLFVGIIITTILSANPPKINRQYFADLLGAGIGCASCVWLMNLLTPPGCVFLGGLILVLGGARLALESRGALRVGLASATIVFFLALAFRHALPDPIPDASKTMANFRGRAEHIFSRWNPIFRVDVLDAGPSLLISHDGLLGSAMYRFNGDVSSLARFDRDPRSFPFRVGTNRPRVLIIGAAGGHEILASLYFGARQITAVELNPVTTSLLTRYFADYTGHLADNERVALVNAEGRAFLARDHRKYDLIWFVAPDSYAAMNAATSGAFVLSESYLYTVEAIQESLDHLDDAGVLCVLFGEAAFVGIMNRTVRYVATAREAFRRRGIADFDRHILVANSPDFLRLSTILLKRRPSP